MIQADEAEPEMLSFFIPFLVKTWSLHYSQCNLKINSLVRDSRVMLAVANIASSHYLQAEEQATDI